MPFVHVFEKVLDTFDSCACLEVDMSLVLFCEVWIVWNYPSVVDLVLACCDSSAIVSSVVVWQCGRPRFLNSMTYTKATGFPRTCFFRISVINSFRCCRNTLATMSGRSGGCCPGRRLSWMSLQRGLQVDVRKRSTSGKGLASHILLLLPLRPGNFVAWLVVILEMTTAV
jgi:hypothetical protein